MLVYLFSHFLFPLVSFSFVNSSFLFDDGNLDIAGYVMVRDDHPANSKRGDDHPANSQRGGVCIYCKNSLPLKVLDIWFLLESIAFDLRITHKLYSCISIYRSPNQSYDDFVSILDNFELTLDTLPQKNSFLMLALGDFNAKSNNPYNKYINSNEGRKIEAVASQNGLHQEIMNQHIFSMIPLYVLISFLTFNLIYLRNSVFANTYAQVIIIK